jgi:hypothetical protein
MHQEASMKKVQVLFLAGLSLVPTVVQAQTIYGVVVDDSTRTPIAGAIVELLAPGAKIGSTTQTDSAGAFLLRPHRSGSFTLRLRHLAYAPVDSDTLTLRSDESIRIELRMAPTTIPLEPLVVTARSHTMLDGFYERMRRSVAGRFLQRSDIERRPGARSTDLLREMPGVEIVPVRQGMSATSVNLITMGGGLGRCTPTIYIDGMLTKQFPESGVDDLLTPDMLEGVEVYTSVAGVPSPLTPHGSCGVVAFWTRRDGRGPWKWEKLAIGAGAFLLMVLLVR